MINMANNQRADLHKKLVHITGSGNVYYQPPESVRMNYPCIRYEIAAINNTFADNEVYAQSVEYMLTVIDKNPDSEIVRGVSQLPTCKFNRRYTANNLYHTVFIITI